MSSADAETKDAVAADATPPKASTLKPSSKSWRAPTAEDKALELESGWSIWFSERLSSARTSEDYKNAMKQIGTFNTLDGFWKHFVHLKRPSEMPAGANIYIFREGHFPSWEDFPNGGCWILKVARNEQTTGVSSKIWQDLVFSTIGEAFEEPDVCGIVLATRNSHDMVSVWNATNHSKHIRFNLGNKLKDILQLDPATVVNYKFHGNSVVDGSTYRGGKAYSFSRN
jgi:translation initiation factor 4E